jgi:hypothetical protein
LCHFSGNDAAALANLIGSEAEDFLAWLRYLEKYLPPEEPVPEEKLKVPA